uniref:NADH-ubiquinone oxidoreductase chain 2 n=1 Tax=Latimeria chalumnae TaxID=7897 RepID=A1IHG8_LATCH|nr:NADH dehydrogenase subunit 2 [Latimeria chalumnae]BAF43550.1 NADH dehydrogenase subunit 2 [Latimeria chalumnae]BAL03797.1 NADH dehydrogenase subunit 2 [Latimeria chalumnae]BAL03810.1 NADH dehydrogenase subunit 2 [Latimeria chalumnae]BAL03823.1 NADH dehydrogenase subunit 2 [Latimeria chalumnae]
MSPYVTMILISSLGLGTTITFTSSSWLMAWMGLEINTLAITPLMVKQHHPRATEATTKYFLTQATASGLLLFATLNNAWMTGEWNTMELSNNLSAPMITMALALKMGVAPMHFWLPEVLQGLPLLTGLILSTWQKLAPFTLLYMTSHELNTTTMTILGLTSTIIGGLGGLNQTQLRKVLAYSSIAHLGWMVIIIQYSKTLALLNLLLYITMTSTAFLTLMTLSATKINTLSTKWAKTPIATMTAMLALLALGGLPPLTGFMPKWLILQELTKQNLPALATLMALSALLSLFFYLRLCHTMTLTISPNTNNNMITWRKKPGQKALPLAMLSIMTLMALPTTPTMMAIMN